MEVSPLQKIIIDDFNSHLSNLKSELRTVSGELAEAMRLRNKASNELDEFLAEKEAERGRMASDVIRFKNSLASFEESKKEMKIIEEQHAKNLESTELKISSSKKDLTTIREDLARTRRKLDDMTELIGDLHSSIKKLQKQEQEVVYSINELKNQKRELSISYDKLKVDYDNASNVFGRSMKIKQDDLAYLENLVQEEKNKIALPLANLKRRERILNRRETNYQVVLNRFRREFKKLHPGLEPLI